MRNVKKIMIASLAMTIAFGAGILTLNNAVAESAPVLDEIRVENGMSIRTTMPEGLRFQGTIAMSDEAYVASGITEVGMVLMPASQVTGELTIDEVNGGVEALVIPTQNWVAEDDENSKTFYSVLVNKDLESEFPVEFYNVPISARAYAKYSDGTVKYSANTATRSIGYVASMCYISGGVGADSEVVQKIASAATRELVVNGGEALSLTSGTSYEAKLFVGGVEAEATENVNVVYTVTGDAVTVNAETGIVSAVKAGQATVTATINEAIAVNTTVTVTAPEVVIEVNKQIAVVGQSSTPTATVTVDGQTVADAQVTYASANPQIVNAENGAITGVAHGETTLVATYTMGNYSVNKEVAVTVFDSVISTVAQFKAITGANWYVLANNIDFSGTGEHSKIAGDFSGLLDGNGYTVMNVALTAALGDGIFEKVSGTIRRIAFKNVASHGLWDIYIISNTGLIAQTISGTLEDVYVQGTLAGYATAVLNPSHWGAGYGGKAGAICSDGTGATFKNVIIDVAFDNNTDCYAVCGGVPTYGFVTIIESANRPQKCHDGYNSIEGFHWFGAGTAATLQDIWKNGMAAISPNVWNVVDGQVATLIPNCTGVVPVANA